MKLTVAAFLAVTGVGLLASASPIPETPETTEDTTFPGHFRFGFGAAVQRRSDNVGLQAIRVTTFDSSSPSTGGKLRGPCAGAGARARFRQKSLEMSNAIRKTFGLSPININIHEIPRPMPLKPMELRFIEALRQLENENQHLKGPIAWHVVPPSERPILELPPLQLHHGNGNEHMDRPRFHAHHHHHSHGPHFRVHRDESFMMRLHYALMSLGPWEGRAVAFVLGCGIGVLIRMIWVLVVVGYRAVNGSNEEEQEEGYLRLNSSEMDAEEIFVAPPQYVVDEKPPVVEETEARK